MNRKTLIALVVFIALGALVWALQRTPRKGERVGARERPMPKVEGKKVQELTIDAKGKTVVLSRSGGGWRLTKPVAYKADAHAAKAAIEKLEKLEFGDLVSDRQDRHGEFEVDDKKGVRVRAAGADKKVLADFYLGKTMDSFTLLRIAGQQKVYQAIGSLRSAYAKEVRHWRHRKIIDFKRDKARKLEITSAPEGTVVLSRKDGKAPWKVDSSPLKIEKLDKSAASNLLSSLYSLSAVSFADGAKPATTGLDKPSATIAAHVDGEPKPIRLHLGKEAKDGRYAQRQGNPQVFVIPKHTAKQLLKRPIDLRDKTIFAFAAADVSSLAIQKLDEKDRSAVTLRRKGSDWLGGGKKVKSPKKIEEALKTLSKLKAESFARHSAEELGMNKPGWRLTIQLKDKTRHELAVGSAEKERAFGLGVKGRTDLYMLRKYVLDRFLLDPKKYL